MTALPAKTTIDYEPLSITVKSQCMTTRPSCPTLTLFVQWLQSFGMPHATVGFNKFRKIPPMALLTTVPNSPAETFSKQSSGVPLLTPTSGAYL